MNVLKEKKLKTELFEFQNWDVYRKSLMLTKSMFVLSKDLSNTGQRNLSDQLNRAASSIPLNLAEGVSRFSLKDKVNFWRVSKGSLFECVAIIDLVSITTEIKFNKTKILEEMSDVGRMLSGLIRWADSEQKKG